MNTEELKELAENLAHAMRNTWNGKLDAQVYNAGRALIDKIRNAE